jgi:hypothetical protein
MIDRYINRPTSLDNLCFANFCAHYKCHYKKAPDETEIEFDIQETDHVQQQHQQNLPKKIQLKNNSGNMALRKRPVIIRAHQFSKDKTPEEFYHSKLMLYYPWRDETTDLKSEDGTYESKFREVFKELESNLLFHEPNANDVEDAARLLEENGTPEDSWAQLASQVEQDQEDDRNKGCTVHQDHSHLDTGHTVNPQDIGLVRYQYELNTNQVSRKMVRDDM